MSAAIFTVVDDVYEPFGPIFRYCCKKAYPEYDCYIRYLGRVKPFHAACCRFLWSGSLYSYTENSTLRKDILSDYDYVLITDADILIRRESPDFVAQHLNHMKFNNLKYYDNCDHGDHMPGVHFVTREWWDVTRTAREKYLKIIETKELHEGDDEIIIKNIVTESNLTVSKHPILWAIHGIHLGRFRNKGINAVRFQPNEFEFIDSLLGDNVFMDLVEKARKESAIVENVFKNVLALYEKRRNG